MPDSIILLVEGRAASSQSLSHALTKGGFEHTTAHTGAAAFKLISECMPSLVVFDASTMRSSGTRTCRRLRRVLPHTPIIHSRAAGTMEDRSAEADGYLLRPFTPRKLLNRVKVLLPADDQKEEIVRFGKITFYKTKRSVDVVGKGESRLTPKLARLLEEFVRHPNEIISRKQLMRNVWHTDYVGDTRTLDVHVRWIRESIEEDPASPRMLKTVRGKGYILSVSG